MKNFSECWSCNRPAAIKQYLDLIHSFNGQGQKKKLYMNPNRKLTETETNTSKIRVTMLLKKIVDKILDTAALMCPYFC